LWFLQNSITNRKNIEADLQTQYEIEALLSVATGLPHPHLLKEKADHLSKKTKVKEGNLPILFK
jgi:hypothetical protein